MAKSKKNPFLSKLPEANLSSTSFPDLSKLKDGEPAGMQRIVIPPNHLLTPHLHPNSNETTICLSGTGKVALITPDDALGPIGASIYESDFNSNSVVFLPQGFPHYFRNVSPKEDLVLLLTFENFHFDIITLADLMQKIPVEITTSVIESAPEAQNSPIIKYK